LLAKARLKYVLRPLRTQKRGRKPPGGWAGDVSNFLREITETALAHVIGEKAEQAYRRSDAPEKRRKLMEAWSASCKPKTSGNGVQMAKRKTPH
jgi:hypothetical protein